MVIGSDKSCVLKIGVPILSSSQGEEKSARFAYLSEMSRTLILIFSEKEKPVAEAGHESRHGT